MLTVGVLLPGTTVSFTKPGKNKVLATVNVSGLETLTFHAPEELLHPTDSKGKAIYQEEAKDGELNAAAVEDLMQKLFKYFSISSWITMVLILAGIAAVLAKKDKKLPILLFLFLFFFQQSLTFLLCSIHFTFIIFNIVIDDDLNRIKARAVINSEERKTCFRITTGTNPAAYGNFFANSDFTL